MMGYGWGMGGTGWFVMLVFWALLIGVIVWAVARLLPSAGPRGAARPSESPEEILDRRFARGEIDAEQYRQARDELAATRAAKR